MKKNKKGFTLIELLAVIVILGVLLLIAVPAATSIINSSKKKSFESAAKLAIENVEMVASTEKLTNAITPCKVMLINIDLERGEFGKVTTDATGKKTANGWKGYVTVNAEGKGTIFYSNGVYMIDGGTTSSLSATKSVNAVADSALTECTWYEHE